MKLCALLLVAAALAAPAIAQEKKDDPLVKRGRYLVQIGGCNDCHTPAYPEKGGKVPEDAWGNPYQYEMPGRNNLQGFDLWSLGADGQPGGTDTDADIGNWAEAEEEA